MGNILGDLIHVPRGRLTLETGVAISTSDQTAKTTIYFTPFRGNTVPIYDTSASVWTIMEFSEISLSLSGFTADKNSDVFVYNNAGTLALERVEWTNDITRATAITLQDGRYVKSGDASRLYVGTFRTTGTTGQCEDSEEKRYVWNYYNRVVRIGKTYNSNASWTYGTAAWREANNGTGQVRFQFIVGVVEDAFVIYSITVGTSNNASDSYIGLGIDTTGGSSVSTLLNSTHGIQNIQGTSLPSLPSSVGYHYVTITEYCGGGTLTHFAGTGRKNSISLMA